MHREVKTGTGLKVLRPELKKEVKPDPANEQKDLKPEAKLEAKPPIVVSQKESLKKKLETVRGKISSIATEIARKEKAGEPLGTLFLQKRSLRSWEARFTKRLQSTVS
ncbi:MAG: hypothetical protein K1X70_11860 [Leptospirales bacterium]|nr:hypothetical protein [Leptospirales bacterium]HNJ04940.1 hypothetical protein [Leptospiraceae bacterium]